jgi:Phosphotransferase enzyme family
MRVNASQRVALSRLARRCLRNQRKGLGQQDEHKKNVEDISIASLSRCGSGKASTSDRARVVRKSGSGPPEKLVLKTILLPVWLRFGLSACTFLATAARFLAAIPVLGSPLRAVFLTIVALFQWWAPHAPDPLYENEVRFYSEISPSLLSSPRGSPAAATEEEEMSIWIPACRGAFFDPDSREYGILLEDLSAQRDMWFPRPGVRDVNLSVVERALDSLAALHAHFWGEELDLLPSRMTGGMHDVFAGVGRELVRGELARCEFKGRLCAKLGRYSDPDAAWPALWKSQEALDRRPWRTLCHGDAHAGNLFVRNGRPGFLDWQLCCTGNPLIDVSYLIATSLDPVARRDKERALFERYLASLARLGIRGPDIDAAMDDHALALVFGLVIGWLICPEVRSLILSDACGVLTLLLF